MISMFMEAQHLYAVAQKKTQECSRLEVEYNEIYDITPGGTIKKIAPP